MGANRSFASFQLRALACLVAGFVVGAVFVPQAASADEATEGLSAAWHHVHLADGQTYDTASASANTTVHIDKPGTYTLAGYSEHVRVVIESGGVRVFLADGLNINTGTLSNVGQATAGIVVDDMGGDVTLVSKAGAQATVSGYAGDPAIAKNGKRTRLIFETEDLSNPGTITATASIAGGAGIGTYGHVMFTAETVGNMIINSGNIVATGGMESAGIGGGDHGNLVGLIINGGNVTARGGGNPGVVNGGAAGIGGGRMGNGSNITINGGTVNAYGGENGAGIGGGMQSSSWGGDGVNIRINGGTVTAVGRWGGAGIGGGWDGNARNISIYGGTVTATGGQQSACGIGGGGGNYSGTGSDLRIAGGTVVASSTGQGCAAIGSTDSGDGETSVTISGGDVTATSDKGCGIGGGGKNGALSKGGKTLVTVSGGTIVASGGAMDVGSWNKSCTIGVIGGSLKAKKTTGSVVDQASHVVVRTDIALEGVSAKVRVVDAAMTGVSPQYGMNDVSTLDGNKLYFWLPSSAAVTSADDSSGRSYYGSVGGGTAGTLYPATMVTLDANGGVQNGSGIGVPGQSSLEKFDAAKPAAASGKHVRAYVDLASGGATVVDANGAFIADTSYADASGRWTSHAAALSLYAQWDNNAYTVAFDANAPERATNAVTGTMAAQSFSCNVTQTLSANVYGLRGWKFSGWNTAADGSGSAYADGAAVDNLSLVDGSTVVLYAQWEPLTYVVSFDKGDGAGVDMPDQTFAYDTPQVLSANTYTKSDSVFLGWSRGALGRIYHDGETVRNVCSLDAAGVPQATTLTAQWTEAGVVAVSVTNDEAAVPGLSDKLVLSDGSATWKGFVEIGSSGMYTLAGIPAGTYKIALEGYDTLDKNVTVETGKTTAVDLAFCTVRIDAEPHSFARIVTSDGSLVAEIANVPVGTSLALETSVDEGYRFESYTASGSVPSWENGDQTVADQTVTITGQVLIEAHPTPVLYQVAFNANGGSGSTMPNQDFVYDQSQALFSHGYERAGYSFVGWTLTEKWTGHVYGDGEVVSNVSTVDGATVTMYAQWEPQAYYIEFNGNGGNVGLMLDQKCFYDLSSKLVKNDFTLDGYHFVGWDTASGGTGTRYADQEEVTNLTTEKDEKVALWAQWEHDAYLVSYDPHGGSGTMEPSELWCYEEEELSSVTFTWEGHTFTGWNTAADGSGTAYADAAAVTDLAPAGSSVTLYAQWTASEGGGGSDPTPSGGGSSPLGTGDAPWLLLAGVTAAVAGLLALALALRHRR